MESPLQGHTDFGTKSSVLHLARRGGFFGVRPGFKAGPLFRVAVKIASGFKVCVVFPYHLIAPCVVVKAFFFLLFQIFNGALLNAAIAVPCVPASAAPRSGADDLIPPVKQSRHTAQALEAVPFDLVHAVAGYADILPDVL